MLPRALLLPLACGISACGGVASSPESPPDAGADVGSRQDSGLAGRPDAGWTQCTSPEGYAVCGGPAGCPSTSSPCDVCGDGSGTGDGGLSACINPPLVAFDGDKAARCDQACPDGSICVDLLGQAVLFCAPFDMGMLFANNGGWDQVRYADMGIWTGAALPLPADCPVLAGVQLCGGNCGPCGGDERCTGRSPLHPFSFCVPKGTGGPCDAGAGCAGPGNMTDAGVGCFTYKVQPSGQALEDSRGMCLPGALCTSAAAGLPGGGTCSM